MFRLTINTFRVELTVSDLEFKIFSILYFSITTAAVCDTFDFMAYFGVREQTAPHLVLLAAAGFNMLYFLTLVALGYRCRKLRFSDPIPASLKVLTRMGFIFIHISFPLTVWSFSTSLAFRESDWILWTVGPASLALGIVLSFYCLEIATNSYPTEFLGAKVDKSMGLAIYLLVKVGYVLGALSKVASVQSHRLWCLSAASVIFLYIVQHLILWRKYWSADFNTLVISLFVLLLAATLLTIAHKLGITAKMEMLWLITTATFTFKLVPLISSRIERVNVFDRNASPIRRSLGFISLVNALILELSKQEKPKKSDEDYLHYRGLLVNQLKSETFSPETRSQIMRSPDKLYIFLIELLQLEIHKPEILKLCMKFQLLCLLGNLPAMRHLLLKAKSTFGEGIAGRFEYMHINTLIEAKTSLSYFSNEAEEQSEVTKTLIWQYKYLSQAPAKQLGKGFVDISRPLKYKETLHRISKTLQEMLESTKELFERIGNASKGSTLEFLSLYKANQSIKSTAVEFEKYISEKVRSVKFPPSFFFGPLYVYYTILAHESSKGNWAIKQFRKAKLTWQLLSNKNVALQAGEPDVNSVVIKVSVHGRQKNGMIIDISNHYHDLLGTPQNNNPVGRSINELFPKSIGTRHHELMVSNQGFESLLNKKRDFPLKRFDGEFCETRFIMKVHPEIQNDINVITAISPLKKTKGFLALLNCRFDILEAETPFWNAIELADIEAELKNITDFLPIVAPVFEVLRLGKTVLTALEKEPKLCEEGSGLLALKRAIQSVAKLNSLGKIVYRVSPGSPFYFGFKNIPITCRLEEYKFDCLRFVQAFVTFEVEGIVVKKELGSRKESREAQANSPSVEGDDQSVSKSVSRNIDFKYEADIRVIQESSQGDEGARVINDEMAQDARFILKDLTNLIDKVFDTEVHYCDGELRDGLVEMGRVLYSSEGKKFAREASKRSTSKGLPTFLQSASSNSKNLLPNLFPVTATQDSKTNSNGLPEPTLSQFAKAPDSPELRVKKSSDFILPFLDHNDQNGKKSSRKGQKMFMNLRMPISDTEELERGQKNIRYVGRDLIRIKPISVANSKPSSQVLDTPKDPRPQFRLRKFKGSHLFIEGILSVAFQVVSVHPAKDHDAGTRPSEPGEALVFESDPRGGQNRQQQVHDHR